MSVLVVVLGVLIAIPVFLLRLIFTFIKLGCGVFYVKTRTQPPECLQDPTLGEHKFVNSGDIKLHYVESGDKGKPLLVFVHGFPEFWFSWRHQIKHFQKNYHVVAFDMRGYNDSDKPPGVDNYSIPVLVSDVLALVDSLGSSRFTLVAHDWGGIVAWYFAALHPERLDSLVACNIPHPVAIADQRKKGWEQTLKSWYILMHQCPIVPELLYLSEDIAIIKSILKDANLDHDDQLLEAFKYAMKDYKTWNRAINYYRSIFTSKEKLRKEFGNKITDIKVRTLCIFGTGDKYLAVEAAKNSSKYVQNMKLEVLDGVSHWVQQEQPDKVNKLIEKFIEK